MIEKFLEGNKTFVQDDFKKDLAYYQEIARGQKPTALWIACSDSRVNPERIAGARMGEIFVHRNIGNIVPDNDLNLATVLEYAVNHLKVQDIVVCGHSECGAMKALDAGAHGDTYIPQWLENAGSVKEKADTLVKSRATPSEAKARQQFIEIENIRTQIEHLKTYPLVKAALDAGRITLHGLYYNIETGELSKVF